MKPFDIAPFAMPNGPTGELLFEEARDIESVEVVFGGSAPSEARLEYKRKVWPHTRIERPGDLDQVRPMVFGWARVDDLFTPLWIDAATEVSSPGPDTLRFTFRPLRSKVADFPDAEQYNVTFRRTVGVRVIGSDVPILTMRVFTCSRPTRSRLRIELHAGCRTPATQIDVEGYNALVCSITPGPGTCANGSTVRVESAESAHFELDVEHMHPAHRYAHDDGHLLFALGQDAFTISLTALEAEGPIWFAEAGIYVVLADDTKTFPHYYAHIAGCQTVARQVSARPEQSLAGAMNGQPRPHPIAYCFGCKHARQKFWIEPCGDLRLTAWPMLKQAGRDTPRWKNQGDARWLFGFDRWAVEGRHNDPWPVMAYNLQFRRNDVRAQIKSFAVPLTQSILAGEPRPDDIIVALMRFSFQNVGDHPAPAELPVAYSPNAAKTHNRRDELGHGVRDQTDTLVPLCPRETLILDGDRLLGEFEETTVLRMAFQTDMTATFTAGGVNWRKELGPGERCEFLARIPYVAVESQAELDALRGLDWDRCYDEMAQYWRAESRKGAQIHTPDAHLNAVYAGHLPIVLISDLGHPDGSGLVNTSVGTATYGNYTNESVMIIEELAQRGLIDQVRRRLAVWTRYQGTVGLIGRFTDYEGLFFGAGGLESGQSYNQHHGWALWALACHYLHTDDREWFEQVVPNVVRGVEWIVRQRRETMGDLPHSRGWERGFLPAGALEDVDDFFYWLSTNCLTWRGLDSAAAALKQYGHPQAVQYQEEADAFRGDLVRGFEMARRHSPLIRLRDGRWIPHYPSRLYCRGRDYGWIREVLEGSVYLLLSGLYDAQSQEGGWILDDYLDTRYMNPPFGYRIQDPQTEWFDCGGFSAQPNLLAGLLPHLDRDEIEVYLWMFFNAWAACYREEVQAMVEHPQPVLGFSNTAPFKTSDQSNAMKWLAYMFVYERNGLLHLGRAIPRAWFAGQEAFGVERLYTPSGAVSLTFRPHLDAGQIEAEVELKLRQLPDRLLLRFRHPHQKPICAVWVNDQPHQAFDAASGDIELVSASGRFHVSVTYSG
ncbi:MAG: hypothetical protein JW934_12710 [Anaerolineae bacterium]|nr:hypothetical protein [Anaerolineae bacterium]